MIDITHVQKVLNANKKTICNDRHNACSDSSECQLILSVMIDITHVQIVLNANKNYLL